MSTVREAVEYRLTLVGNLPKAVPEITKSVNVMRGDLKEAERAWDSVGRAGQKSLSILGGAFGDFGDVAFDLREAITGSSAAIGTIGVVAAGAAVGVGVLVTATIGIANAAVEAKSRLEEQGLAAILPPEAAESLDAYEESTTRLRQATDLLIVSIGSELAEALTTGSYAVIGMMSAFDDLAESTAGFREKASEIGNIVSWLSPVRWEVELLKLAFDDAAESGRQVAQSFANAEPSIAAEDAYAALGLTSDTPTTASRPTAPRATSRPAKVAAEASVYQLNIPTFAVDVDALVRELRAEEGLKRLDAIVLGMGDNVEEYSRAIAETADMYRRQRTDAALARTSTYLDAAASGDVVNIVGAALSNAGPIGAVVTGILSVAKDLGGTADSLTQSLRDITDNFGPGLQEIISEVPQTIINTMPSAVAMVATLIPSVIAGIVEATLQIFSVDFWRELGNRFAEALKDAVDSINPFDRKDREQRVAGQAGTNQAAKGLRMPDKIPSFAEQTPMITQSGLAIVHRGEEIRKAGSGNRTVNISIGKVESRDPVDFVRRLQRELGPYGLNLSLTGRP